MSIEDKRDQLTEELLPFEDHLERFAYIIDRAKDAPGLDKEYKMMQTISTKNVFVDDSLGASHDK
mgnify:CR=1 FL=1